jgi:hypothetical protein
MPERKHGRRAEVAQTGWTRVRAATSLYEYQFQGEMPTMRGGQ